MNHWTYASLWEAPKTRCVTLGEGGTPLIRSVKIGSSLGMRQLWFKFEGSNPTGSYKDRFASAAVSHLLSDGKRLCVGTSSGNTGSALAAYCARASITCILAIVEGAPDGKLKQMLSYGAHLTRIAGFGASPETNIQVMGGLKDLAVELNAGLEISAYTFSPRGMAGVMTLSFEIAERLDPGPLHIFCPAGGGGLTLAVARGFELLNSKSLWNGSARVHCVQPKGNDTIASALRNGAVSANAVQSMTAVSGLQVGNVLDGDEAIRACRRSGGQGYTVSDDQVWECQSRLALEEGIFCEPAGAVGLAGLFSAISKGEVERDEVTVCLVTGSGFKDARALDRMVGGNGAGLVSNFAEFANKARGQLKTK